MSLAAAIATARGTTQSAVEDAHAGTVTINGDDYDCAVIVKDIATFPT